MNKRLTPQEIKARWELLCVKYPNINPREGENLNIEENINAIFKKLWNERLLAKQIASLMGISEKKVYTMARQLRQPYRIAKTCSVDSIQSLECPIFFQRGKLPSEIRGSRIVLKHVQN